MAHPYAKIHVAAKQLGLDDDDQRDLYERVTGERSLRAMSGPQLAAVNDEFRRLGFKPTRRKRVGDLSGHYGPKMRALWMAAWNLGVVRNRTDKAMIAWTYRQTQIEHLNWLRNPEDANKAIDALKLWMRRGSGCPHLYTRTAANWAHQWQRHNPAVQVIYCQWDILQRHNAAPANTLYGHLKAAGFQAMERDDRPKLHQIQAGFGQLVRACK